MVNRGKSGISVDRLNIWKIANEKAKYVGNNSVKAFNSARGRKEQEIFLLSKFFENIIKLSRIKEDSQKKIGKY